MLDRIEIKDLLVRTIIGINEDERNNRQDTLINVILFTDTRRAAETDDISDAVNYRTITKNIIDFVENSRFHLVEALAEEIAKCCMTDERVKRVRVSVEKPGALRFARSVGIAIERDRGDSLGGGS